MLIWNASLTKVSNRYIYVLALSGIKQFDSDKVLSIRVCTLCCRHKEATITEAEIYIGRRWTTVINRYFWGSQRHARYRAIDRTEFCTTMQSVFKYLRVLPDRVDSLGLVEDSLIKCIILMKDKWKNKEITCRKKHQYNIIIIELIIEIFIIKKWIYLMLCAYLEDKTSSWSKSFAASVHPWVFWWSSSGFRPLRALSG